VPEHAFDAQPVFTNIVAPRGTRHDFQIGHC
jgi:hypothetical protein